jgi:hypothetical protein
MAAAIALVPEIHLRPDHARHFLSLAREHAGMKPRKMLTAAAWRELEALVPEAAALAPAGGALRCLWWGTVLRLPVLPGDPPMEAGEFLIWCGYRAAAATAPATADDQRRGLLLQGIEANARARQLLDIEPGQRLTGQTIRLAYREQKQRQEAHQETPAHLRQTSAMERQRALKEARDLLLRVIAR